MDARHSPPPGPTSSHAQCGDNMMSVAAVMSGETETSADAGSVSSETIMSAASASGGDEAEQPLPPTTLEEMPENPAESSRENRPSKQSDEDADYEKRMEEYERRHQERMDEYFGPPSDDDADDDDSVYSIDSFTKKLISPWDPETDIIDPKIHPLDGNEEMTEGSADARLRKSQAPWDPETDISVNIVRPDEVDEPTPLPPKIETSVEFIDDYIEEDWEQAYKLGTSITLTPHKPSNPFGAPAFPIPANVNIADMEFNDRLYEMSRSEHALHHLPPPYTPMTREQRIAADLPPCWPTKAELASPENGKPVTLKLMKLLKGGPWLGPATFLCEVRNESFYLPFSRPYKLPKHVVAKFQDPLLFEVEHPEEQGPFNEFGRANINFSRETAAYEHLREKGYHGVAAKPPKDSRVRAHIAPEYYGAFIAEIKCYNPALRGEAAFLTRSVGVILLEHIDGRSVLDLCTTHPGATLLPQTPLQPFRNAHGTLDTSKQARLDILKIFIDGYVHQLHAGVTHDSIAPENIIVAPSRGPSPRVALLHYRDSIVNSKRKEPLRTWGSPDHPPHPYDVFKNRHYLRRLAGWFPPQWMDEDNTEYEDWLIETFDDDSCGPYHPRKIRPSTPGRVVSTTNPAADAEPEPLHPPANAALPTKKRKKSSTGILGFCIPRKWLGSYAALDSDDEEPEKESLNGGKKRRTGEEGASKDDAGRK
ncbi:hypothetical protein K4K54_010103 [Colletotrichum sp. SAR 10_86]|nr:hypothetical protein K4K51_009422 [Colletotrichum sp. SAR 10_75]KAI8198714.1 hypothetical protein K4K52_009428 [Colletotrichum sp. SAR 10_76]KAI8218745.1 hypothetical protein K4K54_010103 [Colletotrichum sp. SAR 10_86]